MLSGVLPTYPCTDGIPPHCVIPAPAGGHKVEAMRAACAELDHIANMLEMQDLYERADEIRELSGKLRRDARVARDEQVEPTRPEITRRIGRTAKPWRPIQPRSH